MASFNKVILIGNLTADPELKQTQSGTKVCSFNIAVNRRFSREGDPSCDFITIVAWAQRAEFVAQWFKKGSPILVCGQIQTRSWSDEQGNKRTTFEVVADELTFVASATAQGATPGNGTVPGQAYIPDAYVQNAKQFEDVENDDKLPF